MKIKCPECEFENLSGSDYCQECGHNLNIASNSKTEKNADNTTNETKPLDSVSETIGKIDDVIFKPKKSGFSIKNVTIGVIVVGGLGFLGLIFLAMLPSDDYTYSDTGTTTVDTTSYQNGYFPLTSLTVENIDSEWIGNTFYLKGVLKNTNARPAGNVSLRVDFYWDEETKQLFDTRFVTVAGVSANGAYSFSEPVYINDPNGQFWYLVTITGADYLE